MAAAKRRTGSSKTHYVYLFRDPDTARIRYVGKGTGNRLPGWLKAASEIESEAERRPLKRWIEELRETGREPLVETIPAADDEMAQGMEAALISALWDQDIFNKVHGNLRRFTPTGLPESLGGRRYEPALTRQEVAAAGGAIVVRVSPKPLDGGERRGTWPRMPRDADQSDKFLDDVIWQLEKWWALDRYLPQWTDQPSRAPKFLLGLAGSPRRLWVYGSLRIDNKRWRRVLDGGSDPDHTGRPEVPWRDGALVRVPWKYPSRKTTKAAALDGGRFRGRLAGVQQFGGRILDAGGTRRAFGSWREQLFDVVPPVDAQEAGG
ncbi:hypothetical protein AB0F81_30500 [Actinoplanes sp. NPDC024001]|uniref:hypothetical protein n=1 Tax=Actinoplanes sp. NPDC024001 TaxID=3154598 RepID=UPI0033D707B4